MSLGKERELSKEEAVKEAMTAYGQTLSLLRKNPKGNVLIPIGGTNRGYLIPIKEFFEILAQVEAAENKKTA